MSSHRLTTFLIALMVAQSLAGLLLPELYRDAEWIKATWWGNDWVTLTVAVPVLWLTGRRGARGSIRARLISLGLLAYAAYNDAFYLFGAALNAFFPLYVAILMLALLTLGLALSQLDVARVAVSFRRDTPVRLIGGYLVFVAVGLATVWLSMWAAYVFAGRATPVEPDAFKVVAAIDLSLMVPLLATGGALLWRRQPWGFVLAAMASIEGALYLLVLSVNSLIAVQRGLADAPSELPIWGTLTVFTAGAALRLLSALPENRPE